MSLMGRYPICAGLPVSRSLQFADLAHRKIALKRTDAEDEEYPVQMVDFMLKGAGQEVIRVALKPVAAHILGPYFDLRGASNLLPNIGKAETAFLLVYLSFARHDLRIDQDNFVCRGFLEAEIDYCQTFRNPDLGSRKAD